MYDPWSLSYTYKVKYEDMDPREFSSLKNHEYFETDCAEPTSVIKTEESHNTLNHNLIQLRQLEEAIIEKRIGEFKIKANLIDTLLEEVSKGTEQKIAL